MKVSYIVAFFSFLHLTASNFENETNTNCTGKTFRNVTLAAYYPDYSDDDHYRDYLDRIGKKLRTLQDYLDDENEFITLAMDENLAIPYGTPVCIPELNKHFGHRLRVQVRDTSSDIRGMGYARADICVRSETDSYDEMVNRKVTLVFENNHV